MRSFQLNNIHFRVGTSALENWSLLSKAEKDHWWMHLDEYPSAHVIIETDADLIHEDLVFGRECILNQTPKAPKNARCIYAKVRWVSRGNAVGEAIIKPGKFFYF